MNKQAKKIAEKLNIDDRIEKIQETLEIQRVVQETKVNWWKNTNAVIAWFKSLPDKSCLSFVNFDIDSFYPSISLSSFQGAIVFAREKVDITDTDIIM